MLFVCVCLVVEVVITLVDAYIHTQLYLYHGAEVQRAASKKKLKIDLRASREGISIDRMILTWDKLLASTRDGKQATFFSFHLIKTYWTTNKKKDMYVLAYVELPGVRQNDDPLPMVSAALCSL